MKLKIGILGTRGIPNHYGGFEQFAGYLSKGLLKRGHEVSVYNSHKHPYQEKSWEGVNIIHCYDPEYLLGTAGQFIYDFNCIINARKQKFDILLILGYTSSSVWGGIYPRKTLVVTNMDGLEWKRSKYSAPVKHFLKYAEKWAVKFSNQHIADSVPVKEYLAQKYRIEAAYISYGAELPDHINEALLTEYGVSSKNYFLLIARMEPENHIETILDGFNNPENNQTILVIGDTRNAFGKRMVNKYKNQTHIVFAGPVFDFRVLNTLRTHCLLYFHGHSVGGTNPSLLEAMACGALVAAHDNVFNRAVLHDDAFYFSSAQDVAGMLGKIAYRKAGGAMVGRNLQKIKDHHNWDKIINAYEQLFIHSYLSRK